MKRIEYIDVTKGLGMLLIIWGHCGSWGIISNAMYIINLFHIPLFFFLSGLFLHSNKNFKDFILPKIHRLIKPYYFYGILALILFIIITPVIPNLNTQLFHYCLGMRMHSYIFTGALWFLTSLFSALCISYCILRFSNKIKLTFCILFCFLSWLLCINKMILPFNIDISLYMIPFIILGSIFKQRLNDDSMFKFKYIAIAFFFIFITCSIMLLFKVRAVNFYGGTLGIMPLTFLSGISGIYICIYIAKLIARDRKLANVKHALIFIGKNSITFFIIHQQFIIHPMNHYKILINTPIIDGLIRYLLIILLCYLGTAFINKYLSWSIK